MPFSRLLALWLAVGGFAAETRLAPARQVTVLPAASLTPLDVREAALPLPLASLRASILPVSDVAAFTGEPSAQAVPQAQALGAVLGGPLAQAIAAPGVDPAPAVESFFDGSASRVALLDGGSEAIDARAEMIDGAQNSVLAAYYRFHMDAAGLSKLAMLRRAARRGRDVRLVLDSWGSGVPAPMLLHLMDEGVKIRLYHPFRLSRLAWFWRRSHDKWTIVDGKSALLGDRNIGRHYFGMGRDPWTSREVYAEGPVAAQAQDYAEKLWDSGEAVAPWGLRPVTAGELAAVRKRLDAFEDHFERRKAGGALGLRRWSARLRTVKDARFSHNPIKPGRRISGTGLDLLRMIRKAERTVVIENSYVVLPEIFKRELRRAVARGVRVVVLTNSAKTNNLFSTRIAYEADVPELARLGLELWEFEGPGTLHAKAMVVDGHKTYLGGFNLDPRSLRLNTETGLIADDVGLARDLLEQIHATQARSSLVAFQGRVLKPNRDVPVLGLLWRFARGLLLNLVRNGI